MSWRPNRVRYLLRSPNAGNMNAQRSVEDGVVDRPRAVSRWLAGWSMPGVRSLAFLVFTFSTGTLFSLWSLSPSATDQLLRDDS